MTMRLATHKKTGRIYVGEMKPDGTGFIGQEHDVTSDFLRGVVERAERQGGQFAIDNGQKRWLVTVTEVEVPPDTPQG